MFVKGCLLWGFWARRFGPVFADGFPGLALVDTTGMSRSPLVVGTRSYEVTLWPVRLFGWPGSADHSLHNPLGV